MVTGTLFCPHCGEKITLTDEFETKFCPYCGKDITPALGSAAAAPAQAAVHAAPQAAPAEDARTAETQVRPAPADSREGRDFGFADNSDSGRPAWKRPGKAVWYLAVILCAAVWLVLLYAADEIYGGIFSASIPVLIGLLLMAVMPFLLPAYHPAAGEKKGVRARWTVLMVAVWTAIAVFILTVGI